VLAAASDPPVFLAVLGVVVLVLGFIAVGMLALYVIRRAPKDGSDIGRDPRRESEERRRTRGSKRP
jgi:hypothetical protein